MEILQRGHVDPQYALRPLSAHLTAAQQLFRTQAGSLPPEAGTQLTGAQTPHKENEPRQSPWLAFLI